MSEEMTPEQIHLALQAQYQMLMEDKAERERRLKASRQRFIDKHKEAGDWSEKKAAYNRKYTQMKKIKKLEAEAEASSE